MKQAERLNEKKLKDRELVHALTKKAQQDEHELNVNTFQLSVAKELERQKLEKAKNETELIKLEKEAEERKQQLEHDRAVLKMKAECYTDNVLKAKVLETTAEIY